MILNLRKPTYNPNFSMNNDLYYKSYASTWSAPFAGESSSDSLLDRNLDQRVTTPRANFTRTVHAFNPAIEGLKTSGAFVPDDAYYSGVTDIRNGELSVNMSPLQDDETVHEEDLYSAPALRNDPVNPMTLPPTGYEPRSVASTNGEMNARNRDRKSVV